jgi:hypothetical protein
MLGLAVVVIGAAASTAVSGDNVTVMTWDGPVTGVANIRGVSWRGIPYAAAPVGDLRWKHPTRPMAWTTPIEASTFGPACPQRCVLPPLACQAAVSEDCLFVNVFRPARDGTTAPTLPTLAWIHGGRFEQGSEGVEVYDGQIMANQTGSCVVTINYRIGALAFMVRDHRCTGGNRAPRECREGGREDHKERERQRASSNTPSRTHDHAPTHLLIVPPTHLPSKRALVVGLRRHNPRELWRAGPALRPPVDPGERQGVRL